MSENELLGEKFHTGLNQTIHALVKEISQIIVVKAWPEYELKPYLQKPDNSV